MVLKAVQPLQVKMPDGPRAFAPGEIITLPDQVGRRLLEMAPQQVEVVESNVLCPGVWVEFFSPFFGMCTAKIHEVTLEGCVITNHSGVLDLWRLSGAASIMIFSCREHPSNPTKRRDFEIFTP